MDGKIAWHDIQPFLSRVETFTGLIFAEPRCADNIFQGRLRTMEELIGKEATISVDYLWEEGLFLGDPVEILGQNEEKFFLGKSELTTRS